MGKKLENLSQTKISMCVLSLWQVFYDLQRLNNFFSIFNSGLLTKRLFVANEVLQGCLLHIQSLCEAASGSLTGYGTEAAGIIFVSVDKNKTYSLSEFSEAQHEAAQRGVEKLLALRKQIVLVVWESCAVSVIHLSTCIYLVNLCISAFTGVYDKVYNEQIVKGTFLACRFPHR